MKVEYLAFPTDRFPCFGFAVCSDNGKQYLPEYDENNIVCHFEETVFETMHLQKYTDEYEINIGDDRTYVYYIFNNNESVIGTMEHIRPKLIQVLSEIQDAPFSKLELAEFLNIAYPILKVIQNECYIFLKKIDEKQAQQWASNVLFKKYIYVPPEINITVECILVNNFEFLVKGKIVA
jgi:hypothetical protein